MAGKKLHKKFNFNSYDMDKNTGYVFIDATTVVERKYMKGAGHTNIWMLNTFDFDSGLLTMAVEATTTYSNNVPPAITSHVIAFQDLPNQQVVANAHEALVAMGGKPPPLEQMCGINRRLKKDVIGKAAPGR